MPTGKTVVANWKMHGTRAQAAALVEEVLAGISGAADSVQVILCPPATLLAQVSGLKVKTGGQDCHGEASGAFTGDISALMLKDCGASYVILGHSERRLGHGESSSLVARKAKAALEAGLDVVLCVGETLQERREARALAVIEAQLGESLPEGAAAERFIVAYEPVWAIGSGLVPQHQEIEEVHRHIAALLMRRGWAEDAIRVMYGGSVKASNASEIMKIPAVDGVLVGGASLKADEFCAIVRAAV